jgi:hypothetical protein
MTVLRPTGVGGVAEDRFQLTPRGSFQISRRNLWGKNRSISLFTRVSLRTRDTQEQLQFESHASRSKAAMGFTNIGC